jgi:hypothetical protein
MTLGVGIFLTASINCSMICFEFIGRDADNFIILAQLPVVQLEVARVMNEIVARERDSRFCTRQCCRQGERPCAAPTALIFRKEAMWRTRPVGASRVRFAQLVQNVRGAASNLLPLIWLFSQ